MLRNISGYFQVNWSYKTFNWNFSHFEAEQMETEKTVSSTKRTATTPSGAELNEQSEIDSASVSKNSGLIPASPPKGFDGDFGTGKRPILGGVFHGRQPESRNSGEFFIFKYELSLGNLKQHKG